MTHLTAARECATCPRKYHRDATDSRHWIWRLDGLGLMCRVCQNRSRRGVPTEHEASR